MEQVDTGKKRKFSAVRKRFSAIRKRFSPIQNQILATLSANIAMCGYGIFVGWLSPTLILTYKNENATTLVTGNLTTEDESWVGSVLSLGTVLGTLIFGSLANCIGTKLSLLLSSVLSIIGWLLVIIARYSWHLILSRLMGGTAGGCLFVNVSLYIAEISEDFCRGTLGSSILLFCELGIVLGYIIGTYVPLAYSPYVGLLFPIAFVCTFVLFPSTPKYLLRKGKTQAALASLQFYRNARKTGRISEIGEEFEKLNGVVEASRTNSVKISDFCKICNFRQSTPRVRKAFLVGITLMAVSELSGSFTIVNYAGPMFEASGSTVNPNFSSFCLGGIQILGTLATLCLIDKMGRKFLLIVSTIGVALGTFIVGLYSYFFEEKYDVRAFNLTPVIVLSLTTFVACIGIIPIPYILAAELFPPKVREIGATICNIAVGFCSFTMMKMYPIIEERHHLYGVMIVFCSFAIFGAVFSIFVVEETKGKNLDADEGSDKGEVTSHRNGTEPDSDPEKIA